MACSRSAACLLLQHIAAHTGTERVEDVLILVVNRHDDGLGIGTHALDGARCVDAVQQRHGCVENGDVRVQRLRQADRRLPVGCATHYFVPGSAQQCHDTVTEPTDGLQRPKREAT
jgi:hypothetical protein